MLVTMKDHCRDHRWFLYSTTRRRINPNTECRSDVPSSRVRPIGSAPVLLKWRYIAVDYKRPFTTYGERTARPTMQGAFPLFNRDKSIRTQVEDCTLTSYRSTATWLSNDPIRCIVSDAGLLISAVLGLMRLSVDSRLTTSIIHRKTRSYRAFAKRSIICMRCSTRIDLLSHPYLFYPLCVGK